MKLLFRNFSYLRISNIQGHSGRCTGGGHSTHGGCLGLFRTNEANRSPLGETIDSKLGNANPGTLPWFGVGMD